MGPNLRMNPVSAEQGLDSSRGAAADPAAVRSQSDRMVASGGGSVC